MEPLEKLRELAARTVEGMAWVVEGMAANQLMRDAIYGELIGTSIDAFFEAKSLTEEAADDAVKAVQEATRQLKMLAKDKLDLLATAALRSNGVVGARRYASGQWLTVRHEGFWCDVEVLNAADRFSMNDKIKAEIEAPSFQHRGTSFLGSCLRLVFGSINTDFSGSINVLKRFPSSAFLSRYHSNPM